MSFGTCLKGLKKASDHFRRDKNGVAINFISKGKSTLKVLVSLMQSHILSVSINLVTNKSHVTDIRAHMICKSLYWVWEMKDTPRMCVCMIVVNPRSFSVPGSLSISWIFEMSWRKKIWFSKATTGTTNKVLIILTLGISSRGNPSFT